MRVASVLFLAVGLLQGCTVFGASVAADLNRQHRAEAQIDLAADSLLAPGDSLVLHVTDGREVRGTFAALTADSIGLDVGTYARTDIERAERPWQRASVGRGARVGGGLDVALFALFLFYVAGEYPIGGGW